jgi:hypothetical protein
VVNKSTRQSRTPSIVTPLPIENIKSMVLWVVKGCSVEKAQRFGGTYCLHIHAGGVLQARKQQKLAASCSRLLVLHFCLACSSTLKMKIIYYSEVDGVTIQNIHSPAPRCGTVASVAFILWRVKQAANIYVGLLTCASTIRRAAQRCGTLASVAFILWRVKQAANKLCWLASMCKYNTQGSSTLWNYSKCGVYTVESEAGC